MSEATSGVLAAARLSRMSLTLMRATAHAEFTFTMSNSPRITIGQYRIENPVAPIRYSPFATHASSFPRRVLRPGLEPSLHPPRGVAERRDGARVQRHPQRAEARSRRAVARHARRLRGALRPPAGGRAPLGAPPWRFLAGGRACGLRHCLRIRRASSSRPGRSAWRAGSRASRGQGYKPQAAGRHASLRQRDCLRRRPSMSEADAIRSIDAIQSQVTYS